LTAWIRSSGIAYTILAAASIVAGLVLLPGWAVDPAVASYLPAVTLVLVVSAAVVV
jgi:hypothetical protein